MQTATFQVLGVLLLALLMVSSRPSEEFDDNSYDEDEPHHIPRYHYSSTVHDEETMDIKSQSEMRDGDKTEGEYSFLEADGTLRTVKYYVLGDSGFVATVHHSGQPNDENIAEKLENRKKKQMSHILRVNLRNNGGSIHRDHSMHWQQPIARKQPLQHMIQSTANLHKKVIGEPQRPKRFLIIVPDFTTPRTHEKSHPTEKNDTVKTINPNEKMFQPPSSNSRLSNNPISENQSQNQFINSLWRPVDRNVNNTSKNSNYNLRGHQQLRTSNQRYRLRSPLKKQEITPNKQYVELPNSKGNTEFNKINGERGKSDAIRLPFFPKNDNTKEPARQTLAGHFQKLGQQQYSPQRKHQYSQVQNRQPEMSHLQNNVEQTNSRRPVSQYSVYEHIDESESVDQAHDNKTLDEKQNLTNHVENYQSFPPAEDQQMAEKNIVQHHVLKNNATAPSIAEHKIEKTEQLGERYKNTTSDTQKDSKQEETIQSPKSTQAENGVIPTVDQKQKAENNTVSKVPEVNLPPQSTVAQMLPPSVLQRPSYLSYSFNSKQIPRKNKNEPQLQLSPYLQPPPIQS